MKARNLRLALLAPAVLAMSSLALADATIDVGNVEVTLKKGQTFTVAVPTTMSNKGTVTFVGTIGGLPVNVTKKFKTKSGKEKTKTVKLTIDAKRAGVVDATDAIIMAGTVTAAEEGQVGVANQTFVSGYIPVPLLIVPGLANELSPGAYDPFADAINDNAVLAGGFGWVTKGKRATIDVQYYQSLSFTFDVLAKGVVKRADKMIKKSLFARIDMIGHSTGGILIRTGGVPNVDPDAKKPPSRLTGKVRNVFFLGVPNSGIPLAYLAGVALDTAAATGQDAIVLAGPLLADSESPSVQSLASILLNDEFRPVVDQFLPTFPFATIPNPADPLQLPPITVDLPTLTSVPGPPQIPGLDILAGTPPEDGVQYFGCYYSSVATATMGSGQTIGIDLTVFLANGGLDLGDVVFTEGAGDGITSELSTLMEVHPAWNSQIIPIDLGPGLHSPETVDNPDTPADDTLLPGYLNDPTVFGLILNSVLPLP